MHSILDIFKFQPDRTTDNRISCPAHLDMGKMVFPLFLVVNLLENFQNILKTILAGFQVSNHCPLGFILIKKAQVILLNLKQHYFYNQSLKGWKRFANILFIKIITDSYMYA